MAHTFDIRFARSNGLLAFLEVPANTFRWKGAGRLSIDTHGISIAVRRGLLRLFPHTRRVAAADLKQVLREGQALRVEFATQGSARAVVPFWVRDSTTAEEIVRLLPTTRTVELDHDAAGVGHGRFRPDWRMLALLLTTFAVISTSAWLARREAAPVGAAGAPEAGELRPEIIEGPSQFAPDVIDPARPAADTIVPAPARRAPRALPVTRPETAVRVDETTAMGAAPEADTELSFSASPGEFVPTQEETYGREPGSSAQSRWHRQNALFRSELGRLVGDIQNPGLGDLSTEPWLQMTERAWNHPDFADPQLWPLRDQLVAVSQTWRSYIYMKTNGYPEESVAFARLMAERVTRGASGF